MRKTYVTFVLDRSTSMEGMKEGAVAMFNEQRSALLEADEDAGEFICSFVTFGTDVEWVFRDNPISEVPELRFSQYKPSGCTALCDAIGEAISHLSTHEPEQDVQMANALHGNVQGDVAFLMIIVTDGAENASKEFTATSIKELMDTKRERDDWTIVFCGTTDINTSGMAGAMGLTGVPGASQGTFDRGVVGAHAFAADLGQATRSYASSRSRGSAQVSNYFVSDLAENVADAEEDEDSSD